MLTLHNEMGDHRVDVRTVKDRKFTFLWLIEQIGGKASSSLGVSTSKYFIFELHSSTSTFQDPKSQVSPVFTLMSPARIYLAAVSELPTVPILRQGSVNWFCFTLLRLLFWTADFSNSSEMWISVLLHLGDLRSFLRFFCDPTEN